MKPHAITIWGWEITLRRGRTVVEGFVDDPNTRLFHAYVSSVDIQNMAVETEHGNFNLSGEPYAR